MVRISRIRTRKTPNTDTFHTVFIDIQRFQKTDF